jgi:GGDEF domain-containing protein
LARLGDDEIGLFLPRSPQDGAIILAKRIIESVSMKPFHFASESENIELCAGVFGYNTSEQDSNDMVSLDADQALRYARHALHHAKKAEEGDVFIFNELYPLS